MAERKAERERAERELAERQAQCTYASKEEIPHNAKKWMIEEVMVAFRRFIQSEDDLKVLHVWSESLIVWTVLKYY